MHSQDFLKIGSGGGRDSWWDIKQRIHKSERTLVKRFGSIVFEKRHNFGPYMQIL